MHPIRWLAAGIALAGLLLALPIPILKHAANGEYLLYVASNGAQSGGQALHWYKFSPADEAVSPLGSSNEWAGVVSMVRHPGNKFLYAVSRAGSLFGFAIQKETGNLRLLTKVQTKGKDPCFVFADRKGWMLLVSHCGSGNVESFHVDGDGGVGESTGMQQLPGTGANPRYISASPDNFFLFIPNLERIFFYRFDPAKPAFWPNDPASLALKPGAGPRALAFRPDMKFAYAIDEPGSAVHAFTYKRDAGTLELLDSIATPGHPRAMEMDASGRFLYISSAGDNSISVIALNGKNGTMKSVQRLPNQAKAPGYLQTDPTGNLLLVAEPDSSRIVMYKIDRKTGTLKETGKNIDVPSPACFQIVPFFGSGSH